MSMPARTLLTPEEYLARERAAETKSEFFRGEMYAMVGASRAHNRITVNLIGLLWQQLDGSSCEVFANDLRLRVPTADLYTYPDVVVVCGEPQFEDAHLDTLINPTLVIEVLSESTEVYDRGRKFALYQTIESLREYVLVAQTEPRVEQYVRQPEGRWLYSDTRSLDAEVELPSIGCTLPMRRIYDRVKLP